MARRLALRPTPSLKARGRGRGRATQPSKGQRLMAVAWGVCPLPLLGA